MVNKYNIKEIAQEIRETLKKEFPKFKFSATVSQYAGGRSITLSLMESPIKIIKDYKDIDEMTIFRYTEGYNYSLGSIKESQLHRHHQLNEYQLMEEYNPNNWCNGVFLTEEGHKVLQRAVQIANKHNWDNSDAMTDYFDVNYYLHVHLGKSDKPLKEVI